jgi:hypothetical protein
MQYFEGINERIRFIIKERNLNTRQLNLRLGYVEDNKQAFLKNDNLLPSTEFLGRLFAAFPDLDPMWVLFGEKTETPELAHLIKIISSQQKTIKELSRAEKHPPKTT